jgi:hypothetical protein
MKERSILKLLKKPGRTVLVLMLILIVVFSQQAAIFAIKSAPVENNNRKTEKSKKGEETILLLNVSATVSSFQIHFEPICKIAISLPENNVAVKLIICHFTDYFNSYFQTLLQFIIASKAP